MTEQKAVKRKRLSPEARRAQIIRAARSAFSTSGGSGTRVFEIANEAGITEPFVYRHFSSRDELFKLAILDPLEEIWKKLEVQARTLATSPVDNREEVFRRFHELFLLDVLEMVPLIAAARFADPIEGPQFYSETLFPKIRDDIAALIARFTGWEAGSVLVDLAVQSLMGVHFGIAFESVLSDSKPDVVRIAKDLTRMFAKGLGHAKAPTAAQRRKLREELNRLSHRKPSDRFSLRRSATAPKQVNPASLLPEKKRLSKAVRKDAILAAAREIFLRHGLSGARSKDIARQAGITEAFMFRNVDSKEQMYQASVLSYLDQAFGDLVKSVRDIGSSITGATFLARLNQLTLRFFIEYAPLCSVALFSDLSEGRRYYRDILVPHLRDLKKLIIGHIGHVDPNINPETLRRAITGAQWGISFDYALRFSTLEVDDIALVLTRLFTGGMQAEK
jgi:TetR/AcrR family transcriptional regulator